jgi:pyruvate kinase
MSHPKYEARGTKIIATIGPASNSYDQIHALMHEGVDVFRLNFSHGTHADHLEVIRHINKLNEIHEFSVGILADLQGPKIRVGEVENGEIRLEKGSRVRLYGGKAPSSEDSLYISYDKLASDVQPGERILIDDGKIILNAVEVNKSAGYVEAEVTFGGLLKPKKGVNFPDTRLSMPSLTEKDLNDLDFILWQNVNWIALSFVRDESNIIELRKLIRARRHKAKIIAKIEKPEAVRNIRKIVKVSDGIMIARGDLGVEIPMEEVPAVQKSIINLCIKRSKVVIVATQMMESMITNAGPSRAEVTDVANAVIEGADAVMLSGETAVGRHPELVVQKMRKIIASVEKNDISSPSRPRPEAKSRTFLNDVVCFNAAKLADDLGARAIIGVTVSGYTAFKVSSFRPNTRMYVFSSLRHILSTLNIVHGIKGFYYEGTGSIEETHEHLVRFLKEKELLEDGDLVVHTGTMPLKDKGRTNMIKVGKV